LLLQNRKIFESLRTKHIPWPGYTVLEQNQHFSRRMVCRGPSAPFARSRRLRGRECERKKGGGEKGEAAALRFREKGTRVGGVF
jgi:hypothetical protein